MANVPDENYLYDNPVEPERIPPNANVVIKSLTQQFLDLLYKNDNQLMEQMAMMLEIKTGQKREVIAGGFLVSFALFILLGGHLSQFVCNWIGFAGPAYASFKAIRTTAKEDDTKWLMYWTIFGFFSMLDTIPGQVIPHIQTYWLLKTILLIYLAATNVVEGLFYHWVDPTILYMEVLVGKVAAKKSASCPISEEEGR